MSLRSTRRRFLAHVASATAAGLLSRDDLFPQSQPQDGCEGFADCFRDGFSVWKYRESCEGTAEMWFHGSGASGHRWGEWAAPAAQIQIVENL